MTVRTWKSTPELSKAKALLVGRAFLFVGSGIAATAWAQSGVNYLRTVIPSVVVLLLLWYVLAVLPNLTPTAEVLDGLFKKTPQPTREPSKARGWGRRAHDLLDQNIVAFTTGGTVLGLLSLTFLVLGTGRLESSPFSQVDVAMVIVAQLLITTPYKEVDGSALKRLFTSPIINFWALATAGSVAVFVQAYGPQVDKHVNTAPPGEHLLVTLMNLGVSTWAGLQFHRRR